MARLTAAAACIVGLAATAPSAGADSYSATTPGTSAFTVPAGVNSLDVVATGAPGGSEKNGSGTTLVAGGAGARVTVTVSVTPGQQLQLTVPSAGGDAIAGTAAGGTPDGGLGGWSAGGGGGAARVLSCEGITCSVGVIAAGGGGAGSDGYISASSTRLPGGAGGAAGARGSDGYSDVPVSGGSGGQPGTAGGDGAGGAGSDPGVSGSGPAGGAGGNHGGSYNLEPGGGGGGGGVFGGGGGGAGAFGQDASLNQAVAGGGGGGGGSSLAPPGGTAVTAGAGATPGVVLSWTAPAGPGPGPGPGPGGGQTVPTMSGMTLSPRAFPAAPRGPSARAAKRHYGTTVAYTLNEAASSRFGVVRLLAGRKTKSGRCAKQTAANRHAHKCTRRVTLAGSFTRVGGAGAVSFRFTGRFNGRTLAPGSYRLTAIPSAGTKTGAGVSAAFQILR